MMAGGAPSASGAARSLVGLVVWLYLYLCLLLIGWVALVSVLAGWDPVVVTTESMTPAIRPGDVLLISPATAELADGEVITFRDPSDGSRVTHRLVGRSEDGLRTKGDANTSEDPRPVGLDAVEGVGRVLVPFVGLPVVWTERGDSVLFVAWIVVTAGAALLAATEMRGPRRRLAAERTTVVATARPLRRARAVVGLVIVAQALVDPTSFSELAGSTPVPMAIGAVVMVIGATNLLSLRSEQTRSADESVRRSALVELVVDSLLVVILTLPGVSSPVWVLLAFPVIEAASRFRLRGALIHWAALGVTRIAATTLTSSADAADVVAKLDAVVQQAGVLLLVAVPGAYLAEQLLTDIVTQRQATGEARHRSDLLTVVAGAATEVTRLGADVPRVLVDASHRIGLEAADVCWRGQGSSWTVIAATSRGELLPGPSRRGSGLPADEVPDELLLDGASTGGVLRRHGFETMAVMRLADTGSGQAVLRVASSEPVGAASVDAVRLLVAQARVALGNEGIVEELQKANAELVGQAVTDALTGLANRAGFAQALDKALSATGSNERVVVLFIDLDGFKAVNDSLGHDAGDQLLIEASQRLTGLVGEAGSVARLGGDEFVIILPRQRSKAAVEKLAGQVCVALSQAYPALSAQPLVSGSVGLAAGTSETSAQDLTHQADAAMYVAKRSGKARWVWYDPAFDEDSGRDVREVALESAVSRRQFDISYRPVHEGSALVAIEPSVRWSQPTVGVLVDSGLAALADEVGRSRDVAEHIVGEAIKAAGRLEGRPAVMIPLVWANALGDDAEAILRTMAGAGDGGAVVVMVEEADEKAGARRFCGLGRGRALVLVGSDGSEGVDWTVADAAVALGELETAGAKQ